MSSYVNHYYSQYGNIEVDTGKALKFIDAFQGDKGLSDATIDSYCVETGVLTEYVSVEDLESAGIIKNCDAPLHSACVLYSYGVVHHTDTSDTPINLVIFNKGGMCFKFVGDDGRSYERDIERGKGHIFKPRKLHSLAPNRKVSKPVVMLVIEFGTQKKRRKKV